MGQPKRGFDHPCGSHRRCNLALLVADDTHEADQGRDARCQENAQRDKSLHDAHQILEPRVRLELKAEAHVAGVAADALSLPREYRLVDRPLRVATLAAMVTVTPARAAESPESLYDLTVMQYGKPTPLAAYRGKVSVVVNVASE